MPVQTFDLSSWINQNWGWENLLWLEKVVGKGLLEGGGKIFLKWRRDPQGHHVSLWGCIFQLLGLQMYGYQKPMQQIFLYMTLVDRSPSSILLMPLFSFPSFFLWVSRVWQIDCKCCTIMYTTSATNVHPILLMSFTHTILRFLWVCFIQNTQIIVGLCCIL